jgi:N-acetylneuraminic acid mutarotase
MNARMTSGLLLVMLSSCALACSDVGTIGVPGTPRPPAPPVDTTPAPVLSGQWTTLTAMPDARWLGGVAALDGVVYVAGGRAELGGPSLTAILGYDIAADSWRTAGSLKTGVTLPTVTAVAGRIYVIGGWLERPGQATDIVQVFDPASGTVQQGPPMPTRRAGAVAAALEGRIHVIGGFMENPDDEIDGTTITSHDVFDPATGSWSTRAPLPFDVVLFTHGAVVVNGTLHLVTGTRGVVYVYDATTDSWRSRGTLWSRAWFYRSIAVQEGQLYAFTGGVMPDGCCLGPQPSAEVHRFDALTETWERVAPVPTARTHAGVVTIGAHSYLIGGYQEGSTSRANERFTP